MLAGGGARGVAHIGAIEELESQGFEVHAVAGTSMGALVGGMYASGHLEPFKEWMYTLDKYKVFGLVDFALSTEGLVKGDRVMRAMKELVPDVKIEKMPLPFAAVAADLLTGREVVLDRGGLYDAIRASISIPSVFRPVRRGNQVLVDGGTVNPLPLNRVRREPGDVLVAVDVSAPFSEEMAVRNKASLNYYKVITASSEIMQQHIARLMCKLYKPDLLIEMPADRFGILNSTAPGKLSRPAAWRRVPHWSVASSKRDRPYPAKIGWVVVWFLSGDKIKRLRRPVIFEEFKSSDATSHRFEGPSQYLNAKTSGAGNDFVPCECFLFSTLQR